MGIIKITIKKLSLKKQGLHNDEDEMASSTWFDLWNIILKHMIFIRNEERKKLFVSNSDKNSQLSSLTFSNDKIFAIIPKILLVLLIIVFTTKLNKVF